jgi:hypothetical protein
MRLAAATKWPAKSLFGRGPASSASIGSHEGTGAAAARVTAAGAGRAGWLCPLSDARVVPRKMWLAPDTTLRSRGADGARSDASTMPSQNRGRRESRVPTTPAVVCTRMHTGDRRCAGTPGFPRAMVLTAYGALSPETNSSCLRRRRISDCRRPGWARQSPSA